MCEDEPLELTHGEKINELNMIARYFNLVHIQRSRYELQANEFMLRQTLATETDDYVLKYSIERDFYICRGKPKIRNNQSFLTEIPIPATEQEKIEVLVGLFAQSEAGLI